MSFPVDIEFRNMDRSEAVEAAIHERCVKLERFSGDVMHCRVTVEAPHRHHGKGNLYRVSIDLHAPGKEIIVDRERGKDHAHEDVYVAVRDAFAAARRQLDKFVRANRRDSKAHANLPSPHGRILELIPMEDFGRILTPDGREIYFHRNSLLNGSFDRLEIGDEVRFSEEMGDDGPQASTVHLVRHQAAG